MKLEKFLKIALVCQLVLLIILTYPSNKLNKENFLLSKINKQNISKIVLSENDKNLELTKQSDIWLLKDKFNFPADQEKVGRILESIFPTGKLQRVGKSKNALTKFKLADNNFIEKVSVYTDNEEDTFLLGDTPEFKKIYIRNKASEDSFVIDLAKFDLGTDINSWYQKNFLGLSNELVKKVSFNSLSLVKDNNKFVIENLEKEKTQDDEKVNFLTNKLFSLKFKDILSSDKINLGSPDFKIEVLKEDGTNITLSFKKIDDKYILKVSNMPYDFEVSKNLFNDFKETKVADLLATDKKD